MQEHFQTMKDGHDATLNSFIMYTNLKSGSPVKKRKLEL